MRVFRGIIIFEDKSRAYQQVVDQKFKVAPRLFFCKITDKKIYVMWKPAVNDKKLFLLSLTKRPNK